jgi:hypothetical protein
MSEDREQLDRFAEELEGVLAARQAGDGSRGPDPAADGRPAELALAAALAELAAGVAPDAGFAATLEARLLAAAGDGARPTADPGAGTPSGATTGNAEAGDAEAAGGGSGRPAPRVTRHNRGGRGAPGARAGRGGPRWRLWGGAAALFLIALLVFAPTVRATLRAVLHLGDVTIENATPTAAPHAGPTSTAIPSPLDLAGRTTLAQARGQVGFAIRLPTYPPDLGPPEYVFVQDPYNFGDMVVLVWTVPGHPDRVRMSLHELGSGIFVQKFLPPVIQTTTVDGQQAFWTDGPYLVQVQVGNDVETVQRRLVTGHVLIWAEGGVTYRLETSLALPEAVRVAQSLR